MEIRAALNFANWLRIEHPKLFRQAANRADISLELRNERAMNNGLGQWETYIDPYAAPIDVQPAPTEKTGWLETFMKAAAGLGTTYLTLKNQRDQLQINIERAKIGLDPIDITAQPIITTQIQLDPSTVDKITASAGFQVNKVLLWGGVAAAAFFLLR